MNGNVLRCGSRPAGPGGEISGMGPHARSAPSRANRVVGRKAKQALARELGGEEHIPLAIEIYRFEQKQAAERDSAAARVRFNLDEPMMPAGAGGSSHDLQGLDDYPKHGDTAGLLDASSALRAWAQDQGL